MSAPSRHRARFLDQLRQLTGLPFDPAPVQDLDGQALQVGDLIYDAYSGLHCLVADAEQAVRQTYVSRRSSGGWRTEHAPDRHLAITHDAAGRPVALSWQNEEHQIIELLWPETAPVAEYGAGMSPEQFCYWLLGRAELVEQAPSEPEWRSILQRLGQVVDILDAPQALPACAHRRVPPGWISPERSTL